MYFYGWVIVIIFIVMIVSPVWFFHKVEEILFDEETMQLIDQTIFHVHPQNTVPNISLPKNLETDLLRLERLDSIIKSSKKRSVKKLWKFKKAQLERNIKWQMMVENHQAVQRLAQH